MKFYKRKIASKSNSYTQSVFLYFHLILYWWKVNDNRQRSSLLVFSQLELSINESAISMRKFLKRKFINGADKAKDFYFFYFLFFFLPNKHKQKNSWWFISNEFDKHFCHLFDMILSLEADLLLSNSYKWDLRKFPEKQQKLFFLKENSLILLLLLIVSI